MRLIDADALRKAFKNHPLCHDIWLTYSRELIDKAPTVKITLIPADETKDEAYKRGYEKGRVEGILKAEERAQGKWIEVEPHQSDLDDGITYREECSVCHEPNRHYGFDEYHDIRFATYYKTKFCPNCGAKMQTSD